MFRPKDNFTNVGPPSRITPRRAVENSMDLDPPTTTPPSRITPRRAAESSVDLDPSMNDQASEDRMSTSEESVPKLPDSNMQIDEFAGFMMFDPHTATAQDTIEAMEQLPQVVCELGAHVRQRGVAGAGGAFFGVSRVVGMLLGNRGLAVKFNLLPEANADSLYEVWIGDVCVIMTTSDSKNDAEGVLQHFYTYLVALPIHSTARTLGSQKLALLLHRSSFVLQVVVLVLVIVTVALTGNVVAVIAFVTSAVALTLQTGSAVESRRFQSSLDAIVQHGVKPLVGALLRQPQDNPLYKRTESPPDDSSKHSLSFTADESKFSVDARIAGGGNGLRMVRLNPMIVEKSGSLFFRLQDEQLRRSDANPIHTYMILIGLHLKPTTVFLWNERAMSILGFSPQDCLGKNFMNFVIEDQWKSKLLAIFSDMALLEKCPRLSVPLISASLGTTVIDFTFSVIRGLEGDAEGILCSGVMSAAPDSQEQYLQLYVPSLVSQQIQNATSLNDRHNGQDLVSQTLEQAQELTKLCTTSLVQRLCSYAAQWSPCSIRQLCSSVIADCNSLAYARKMAFHFTLPPDLPDNIRLDEARLAPVLAHLVSGIIRAARADSRVSLCVDRVMLPPASEAEEPTPSFAFCVSEHFKHPEDDAGLTHSSSSALYASQWDGTSALPSVNDLIMESHRQTIAKQGGAFVTSHLTSVRGGHTTIGHRVTLFMPWLSSIQNKGAEVSVSKVGGMEIVEPSLQGEITVLLCEDSPLYKLNICHTLWQRGYAVVIANSVMHATELINSSSASLQAAFIDSKSTNLNLITHWNPNVQVILTYERILASDGLPLVAAGAMKLKKPLETAAYAQVFEVLENKVLERKKAHEEQMRIKKVLNSSRHPWERGEKIGVGSFGEVYIAISSVTKTKMAVKCVKNKGGDDREAKMKDLIGEIEMMLQLDHPNIIQYLFCEQSPNGINIFMEYANRGSLASRLAKQPLNTDQACVAMHQILTAVAYLHGKGIAHRDIKAANVLDCDGILKLADFGTSGVLRDETDADMKGTLRFMAPEVMRSEQHTTACDIWSIGCLLMEFLTGHPPFIYNCPTTQDLFVYISTLKSDEDIVIDPRFIGDVRGFMMSCLRIDPSLRPDATTLLCHPLLTRRGEIDARKMSCINLQSHFTSSMIGIESKDDERKESMWTVSGSDDL